LIEVGWERGLGVECEEGKEVVDVLPEKGLPVLTVWIEPVCIDTSRMSVCPELVGWQFLACLQVRH